MSFANRSVMCGVDGSPQAAIAAQQAAILASRDADVWAVSVWDPHEAYAAGIHAPEVGDDLRAAAEAALRQTVRAHPEIRPVLMRGSDVAGLLAAAANLEADLICVGAHGRSRAAGILFGSAATALAHHAPCSVLISRKPPSSPFGSLVLHASDGSSDSLAAARAVGEIVARHDSTVVTLHVAEEEAKGRGIAEEAVEIIEASGREPQMRVELGSAKRRIVEVAAEIGASLVVVGSRGKTGLSAVGSVSEHVAHRAPCSVLIVREGEYPVREDIG